MFVRQYIVETTYRFVQFFTQARGAFFSSFAGISTDSAGTARSRGTAFSTSSTSSTGICTLAGRSVALFAALIGGTVVTGNLHATTFSVAIAIALAVAIAAGTTRSATGHAHAGNLKPWNAHAACRAAHRTTG